MNFRRFHNRINYGPNGKCLATKHHQTLFGAVWSCLIKFEGLQTFDQTTFKKHFILFSCLMGDVLFVWTASSNMFGARMRTTPAQRLIFIDTASCLRTSLVQCFKHGERRRSFGVHCWKWGDSYRRNAESYTKAKQRFNVRFNKPHYKMLKLLWAQRLVSLSSL